MLLSDSIASNFPLATFCQFGQTRKPAIPLFSTIPGRKCAETGLPSEGSPSGPTKGKINQEEIHFAQKIKPQELS